MKAVKASGLSPNLMRPMVRRLEVALELAKKDKVAFEAKMQDKQSGRDRAQAAAHPRGRQGQEDPHEGVHGQGPDGLCRGQLRRIRGLRQGAPRKSTPTRSPPRILAFKAKTERRYKQDLKTAALKDEGAVTAFQEVDLASVIDPEVQMQLDQVCPRTSRT